MIEMVTTQEALDELQLLERAGIELLGFDGFLLEPDGRYMAPLDLIMDFTASYAPSTTPAQRFAEARRFITANDAPNVRWELVSGSGEG